MSDCTSPAQQMTALEDEQVLMQCPKSEHGPSKGFRTSGPPACHLPRHGDAPCTAAIRLATNIGPGAWQYMQHMQGVLTVIVLAGPHEAAF